MTQKHVNTLRDNRMSSRTHLKADHWAFRNKFNGNTANVRAANPFLNQKQMVRLSIQISIIIWIYKRMIGPP